MAEVFDPKRIVEQEEEKSHLEQFLKFKDTIKVVMEKHEACKIAIKDYISGGKHVFPSNLMRPLTFYYSCVDRCDSEGLMHQLQDDMQTYFNEKTLKLKRDAKRSTDDLIADVIYENVHEVVKQTMQDVQDMLNANRKFSELYRSEMMT